MTMVKVFSARAPQVALDQLFSEFTRETGHDVAAAYGTVGAIGDRFRGGEPADVVILSASAVAALNQSFIAESCADIARAGLAVAVRAGARSPNISSPDAFKATLIAARSISYSDPKAGGSAAAYFVKLIDQLGIAEAVNAKAILGRNGHHVAELTARGDVELGISFLSELVAIDGVRVIGMLPRDLQNYTVYAAAVSTKVQAREPAFALVKWLTRPAAREKWIAAGLEPMPGRQ